MEPPREISYASMLFTSCQIWAFMYGIYLIGYDIFLTFFPTTAFGTLILFGIACHFRVPPASEEIVREVFGEDVNVLMELFEKEIGGTASNGLINLPFIPTTSRLAAKAMPPWVNPTANGEASVGAQPYAMWIVGHRGAGLDAPENSLSAFRLAKSRGCTAVEFDVALTKDLVPVVFHDDTLTRVAGINRRIQDMTYAELMEADISVNHPLGHKFRHERIPTLDEAITTCLGLNLRFFIDIKDCNPVMVEFILEAYNKNNAMYSRAVVSSFNPFVIYHIRRRNPMIIGCMAYRPGFNRYEQWGGDWENLRFRHTLFLADWFAIVKDAVLEWAMMGIVWWFVGLSCLLLHKDVINKEVTYRWYKKGVRVFAWTVNNPLEKLHLTQNFRVGHLTDTLDGEGLLNAGIAGVGIKNDVTVIPARPSSTEIGIETGSQDLLNISTYISTAQFPTTEPDEPEDGEEDEDEPETEVEPGQQNNSN